MILFVDPQGNWQPYSAWQVDVVQNEPDMFRFVEVESEPEPETLYKDGIFIKQNRPSDNEIREAALRTLDSEYTEKISDIELEMAKAKAIEDEDLYTELKEERDALINEYAEKRGEI